MKGEHFHECSQRIEDRGISELIGIARGLVADGVVNELEADFLIRWLKENGHLTCWPFDVLNKRVHAMLADGVIDAEERQELLELLRDLIGGKPAAGKAVNFASALPLTQPAPDIAFADKTFCFTGTFAFGQRKDCQAAVARLGGKPQDKVTTRLDYLVIGSLGNEDWMHSTFGRKIQQALDFNAKGRGIAIVSEDAWAQALCAADIK